MTKICVIGLGYVGLPILLNLSSKYKCVGYDISSNRIESLKKGSDIFKEFSKKELLKKSILYSNNLNHAENCNIFIITVPTPIYKNKKPDLSHLKDVCKKLSKKIKKKDILIFESTVYPGITNDFCIPIIEKFSNLKEGRDFFVGYSPERVNPGDKKHNLKKINKIFAYPYKFRKKEIVSIYTLICKKLIITENIKEAEAAKVIENIQRDVNIGLINEIYLVCKKLNLDFKEIINLASTKWNFLKFKPGLVGGHCLPVDPYYFAHISKINNYKTKIILAGRQTNDLMEKNILIEIKNILKAHDKKNNKRVLLCGLSYKENVSDHRNSLALNIFNKLKKIKKNISGYDPMINDNLSNKLNLIKSKKEFSNFDIYIILIRHNIIKKKINKLSKNKLIFNILNNI